MRRSMNIRTILQVTAMLGAYLVGPWPASAEQPASNEPVSRLDSSSTESSSITRMDRTIEGWRVRVDDRLLQPPNEELGTKALRFLEARLIDIKAVVPEKPISQLQSVTIVLDLECGGLKSMQYHPSAGWLKSHGYST